MKSWRKLRLSFLLEVLRTMGIESWYLLLVLCFWCFLIGCTLFATLFIFGVWPYQFVCSVVFLLVFIVFLFFVSCTFLYVLRVFGIGLAERKYFRDQEELNET